MMNTEKRCTKCNDLAYCQGLCSKHYRAGKRAGIIGSKLMKDASVGERIEAYSRINYSTGCIEWIRYRNPKGYGQVYVDGRKMVLAHRAVWELVYGKIPNDLCVLHRCDNPSCLNVAHLFLGTKTENHADMCAKGRHLYGERHYMGKLTEEKVKQIRCDGRPQSKIAAEYGIFQTTVSEIKRKKIWGHVV